MENGRPKERDGVTTITMTTPRMTDGDVGMIEKTTRTQIEEGTDTKEETIGGRSEETGTNMTKTKNEGRSVHITVKIRKGGENTPARKMKTDREGARTQVDDTGASGHIPGLPQDHARTNPTHHLGISKSLVHETALEALNLAIEAQRVPQES
jgi:hypothetical protein